MYTPQQQPGSKHGVLSLAIKELAVLRAAYLPFVENGGLFIPTNKHYEMGDEIFMLLNLMDEPEKIALAGTVVWITPERSQTPRAPGIGVQFNDSQNPAKPKIESFLAGQLDAPDPAHTM